MAAPLFLTRAVLLRHEAEVAGDLTGTIEPTGHVERGDKGTGGYRTDARECRQSLDQWIGLDKRSKLFIGARQFVIENLDDTAQRRERRGHGRGQVERLQPGHERLALATANAQPGGARDAPRQRNRSRPRLREALTDM
jgi:hypothetical protein